MSPAMDYDAVARLYDLYVRFDHDVPFFLEECRRVTGRVLELTAGTGRVSIPLIEAGVDLTCVDSSAGMLAILQAKLAERRLSAVLVEEDIACLDLREDFELAFIPFNSFAELLTEKEQQQTLEAICRALVPGGRLICTLHNPLVRLKSIGQGLATLGLYPIEETGGEAVIKADLSYNSEEGRVHGIQTIEVRDDQDRIVEEVSLPIQFILMGPQAFQTLTTNAGFETDTLYGDYQRSPFDEAASPFMIWSLRKKS